jgi:hypothetical protein
MVEINNVPKTAYKYRFIVARIVDNEYWYWGAYNGPLDAFKAASEISGQIFRIEDIK